MRPLRATPANGNHGLDMERGVEAAAYVVFGRSVIRRDPWTGDARVRLVSHRVIPISAEEQISASAVHVTWSTRGFVRELARASGEQLVLGIVHSHPGGCAVFSPQDDRNEAELIRAAANRNGAGAELVSLLFGGDGTMASRVWKASSEVVPISRMTVTGAQWRVYGGFETSGPDVGHIFDRQARLFGASFNDIIREMRIGIVGGGGTGSPVAMLLNCAAVSARASRCGIPPSLRNASGIFVSEPSSKMVATPVFAASPVPNQRSEVTRFHSRNEVGLKLLDLPR